MIKHLCKKVMIGPNFCQNWITDSALEKKKNKNQQCAIFTVKGNKWSLI